MSQSVFEYIKSSKMKRPFESRIKFIFAQCDQTLSANSADGASGLTLFTNIALENLETLAILQSKKVCDILGVQFETLLKVCFF